METIRIERGARPREHAMDMPCPWRVQGDVRVRLSFLPCAPLRVQGGAVCPRVSGLLMLCTISRLGFCDARVLAQWPTTSRLEMARRFALTLHSPKQGLRSPRTAQTYTVVSPSSVTPRRPGGRPRQMRRQHHARFERCALVCNPTCWLGSSLLTSVRCMCQGVLHV